ncbi:MAG: HoxN/HupN/NixA family nickel/cobalt transporter [Rhodopila sp.]|nr:HoxN/HupN/NixA family nickel/cobalt transporter [Rhodopila sp.]
MSGDELPGPVTKGFGLPLGGLIAANLAAWLWAYAAFADHPALLGSALLAWLFGLRHAVDADHLAAIDNVVRKLMQDGTRPHLTGLYFSLGHSTIVILACLAIALSVSSAAIEHIRHLGEVIGTSVSATFLLIIAAINLMVLVGLIRARRADRHGAVAATQGPLTRILRPVIRMVRRPAHMYPLGFLFGLGFDTATEVGLLALAATQTAAGVGWQQVLIFPALFTAGMALVDTADSMLMSSAYGWAFIDPGRKFNYNLVVTALSVAVALGIGGIEAAGLLSDRFGLEGGFWQGASDLADQFASLGYGIIAAFMGTWAISVFFYHRRKAVAYGASGLQAASLRED